MWELILKNNVYNLEHLAGIYVGQWDGAGMAPVERITQQGAQEDGETDFGYQLRKRFINLVIWGMAETRLEYWEKRDYILRLFKPGLAALQLRKTLPNGEKRQIDCHYVGGASLPTVDRKGYHQRSAITLECADPTFYDPEVTEFVFGLGAAGMDVPMGVPMGVGAGSLAQPQVIAYNGSWRCSPVIRADGPINNIKIESLTTGEVLNFLGYSIGAGEYLIIDTRKGAYSVTDHTGANKIDALLDGEDDIATFHLAEADDGSPIRNNTIQISGSNTTSVAKAVFTFNRRFIGI